MTDIIAKTPAPAAVLRGIFLMVLSVFLFSSMDAVIKWASSDYPTGQIVFFRNFIAFVPVFLFLWHTGASMPLRTKNLGGHLLRGLVGVASMSLFFLALGLLPLADAMALGMSGPIFLTALSVPLLGERVGLRRWSAVIVGFVGVLVMVRPGSGVFQPAALIALGGAFFYALAMVSIRRLSWTEPATTIVFYFTLFAALVGLLTWPLGAIAPAWLGAWVRPDLEGWIVLIGIGLIGGTAQLTMTYAFKLAPVAVIAPFEYGAIIIGVSYGLAIWNEVPDRLILLGAAIVIASGLYILYREAKLRRLPATVEPPV
ncbi:MAG: DMT family transporter [Dongiaceae bacterium]